MTPIETLRTIAADPRHARRYSPRAVRAGEGAAKTERKCKMTNDQLFVGLAWLAIAYPCAIHAANRFDEVTPLQRLGLISAAVFWPITAVLALPIVVASMVTASVSDIRIRLRNRGVMDEFEEFLAARESAERESDDAAREGDDQ